MRRSTLPAAAVQPECGAGHTDTRPRQPAAQAPTRRQRSSNICSGLSPRRKKIGERGGDELRKERDQNDDRRRGPQNDETDRAAAPTGVPSAIELQETDGHQEHRAAQEKGPQRGQHDAEAGRRRCRRKPERKAAEQRRKRTRDRGDGRNAFGVFHPWASGTQVVFAKYTAYISTHRQFMRGPAG